VTKAKLRQKHVADLDKARQAEYKKMLALPAYTEEEIAYMIVAGEVGLYHCGECHMRVLGAATC